MRKPTYSRRRFLRDIGISAAAVPFILSLDSLFEKSQAAAPMKKRFIFMYSPNGNLYYSWKPRVQGTDVDISSGAALANPNLILNPLQANAKRLLILDRLSWITTRAPFNTSADGASHPGGHQKGMGSLLTGQALIGGAGNTGNAGLANGISVDQVLATQVFNTGVKFPSLEVGVMTNEYLQDRYVDKRVSYDAPAKPRAPVCDPFVLFHTVFGNGGGGGAGSTPTLRSVLDSMGTNTSVLDAAWNDISRLKPKLSSADQQLLQQHADSIRHIETQITPTTLPLNCGNVTPPMTQPGVDPNDPVATHKWAVPSNPNANYPLVGQMIMDIVVQAVACGLTNVVTLQWANSENDMQMPWLKQIDYTKTSMGHHGMSHARDPNLVYIDQFYAAQFNYLINKMAAIPEAGGATGGTLLDNSLLMWSSCLGDASAHLSNNVPVTLAGSNGGYFKQGRMIKFNSVETPAQWGDPISPATGMALTAAADAVRSGDQKTIGTPDLSNNDLMVSILNSFGVNTNTFGIPGTCHGPLPGIKAP
jgi:hypothetical protein